MENPNGKYFIKLYVGSFDARVAGQQVLIAVQHDPRLVDWRTDAMMRIGRTYESGGGTARGEYSTIYVWPPGMFCLAVADGIPQTALGAREFDPPGITPADWMNIVNCVDSVIGEAGDDLMQWWLQDDDRGTCERIRKELFDGVALHASLAVSRAMKNGWSFRPAIRLGKLPAGEQSALMRKFGGLTLLDPHDRGMAFRRGGAALVRDGRVVDVYPLKLSMKDRQVFYDVWPEGQCGAAGPAGGGLPVKVLTVLDPAMAAFFGITCGGRYPVLEQDRDGGRDYFLIRDDRGEEHWIDEARIDGDAFALEQSVPSTGGEGWTGHWH